MIDYFHEECGWEAIDIAESATWFTASIALLWTVSWAYQYSVTLLLHRREGSPHRRASVLSQFAAEISYGLQRSSIFNGRNFFSGRKLIRLSTLTFPT